METVKSKDSHRPDDKFNIAHQRHQASGMTPSIITTINNTSPTPLDGRTCDQTDTNGNTRNKPLPEPYYESYIEDSFVGHWETEDDDPHDEYHGNQDDDDGANDDEDESALHPSTIEFDFDSFGPESFIYAPSIKNTTDDGPPQSSANNSADTVVVADAQQPDIKESTAPDLTQESSILKQDIERGTPTDAPHSSTQQQPQTSANTPQAISRPQMSTTRLDHTYIDSSPVDYLIDNVQIDRKVIEPYKKVISHAGYCQYVDPDSPNCTTSSDPAPAVIVFSACYLPDRSRRDYDYVMDHLFLYVLTSLHELIADDYILIYLHNTQPSNRAPSQVGSSSASTGVDTSSHKNNLPTLAWMRRCYQMIDRRLRKNLKVLYLVKPTFWLKTIVIMCKPFISQKFSKKLRFVDDMDGLRKCLPVDKLILPASADNL